MNKNFNLVGMRFGKLVVIELDCQRKDKKNQRYWKCRCDCGNETIVSTGNLRSGNSKSCGCTNRERLVLRNKQLAKHGARSNWKKDRLYDIWGGIKKRCENPNDKGYKSYGGRGIKICEEWKNNYVAFRDWALVNGYEENLSIDRIDTNKNYCPENCRWATAKQQANNRRNNIFIEYNGKRQSINEWSAETGLSYRAIHARLKAGWEVSKTLEQPSKRKGHRT